ncbi:MAG: YceI family protein [Pseudomonadota bacterium]
MKKASLAAVAAVLMSTTAAHAQNMTPFAEMPAGDYALDLSHASLIWKVSHMGLSNYAGRFTNFEGTLTLDPADPASSAISVTIDPSSVETDYPGTSKDWNAELADKENWFNSDAFPEISFVSTGIELTGDNTGVLTGDLTFLGITKPATLDVTFNGAFAERPFSGLPTIGFSATGSLMRSDWGLDYLTPGIGDGVQLLIEAEFEQDDE